jgi:phasin family protein
MTKDTKMNTAGTANPFGDVANMLGQFKLPGVDMASIIEARRKDIEALVESNKAAYEAMQTLARMQTEMLNDAMKGLQEAATGMAAGGAGAADPRMQAETAGKACQKVLANMKDLAEMAQKSQADAVASLTRRATENMQEIKQMMLPA